ncbi:MAG: HD-GYP domain-containing protein [Spirochaetaceae bacterium]|nr:HD-GYP domain-containing protein [Spirochaetaceae bacterium]
MDKSENKTSDEEDLEILEDLDAGGGDDDEENPPQDAPPARYTGLFEECLFPLLLITAKFRIIYANPRCRKLFTDFSRLEGNQFFDVFGRSLGVEALREIRETVLDGKNGFSWKGYSMLKSRELETLRSRVFIFPLSDKPGPSPEYFEVVFDDVTEENKRLLRNVFMSLLEASRLKDNDTGHHISRVSRYSERLARELYDKKTHENIDADFIDNISFLASMHDVGKIGTPDDILNKEGPLSKWEWTVMREHTKNGAYILSTYPNPMAKEIALSHHEKWDGTGYPFQLIGDMIPLPARIVSVADVYDALRMERSYKPALDHEATVKQMASEGGTHFDPFLIEVFKSIAGDFEEIYESNKDAGTKNPRN